jgi:nucleotide-binding universal stress UspA family protein
MASRTGTGPVVVGVDGSAASLRAVEAAAEEAGRRGAPLDLVTVVAWPLDAVFLPAGPADELTAALRSAAEESLRATAAPFATTLGPDRVRTEAVVGEPVEVLRELSSSAQLLVVGSRGTGGVAGLVLGSTANGVIGGAGCPVLLLPEQTSVTVSRRRSVVVGVEGRQGDDEVLAFAFEQASARGTDLIAVHAWQDVALDPAWQTIGPLVDWPGVRADEERLLAEALAGWRDKQPDLEVREVVLRDKPARGLLAAALTAELLVVGHRRRGALARLGSTTHGVLHRAGGPVAVVPVSASRKR